MTDRFKVTIFDPKPLIWWSKNRTKVDWDPSYQRRGRLWSKTDKSYLVDSIINGFDVPKLYIADFTWGDSKLNTQRLPYAIIDGKQRFEAILDFFDGTVVLNDDFEYRANPKLDLAGMAYRDLQKLHPEIADGFDTASLSVMSVYAENEVRIQDLFVRLNRSKSLTGAEIRNAMGGPAPQVFREIAKHEIFETCIRFSVTRGADLNTAAKIVVFEYYQGTRETKKKFLDKFVKDSQKDTTDRLELAGRRVLDVLDNMVEIFLPKDALLGSAGLLPVYYWFLRNMDSDWYPVARSFLLEFEKRRAENRKRANDPDNEEAVDSRLLEYDKMNSSPNDQKSHERRYEILFDLFEEWDA